MLSWTVDVHVSLESGEWIAGLRHPECQSFCRLSGNCVNLISMACSVRMVVPSVLLTRSVSSLFIELELFKLSAVALESRQSTCCHIVDQDSSNNHSAVMLMLS